MKTIRVRDATYHALVSLRKKDENFSDVIDRLASKKNCDIARYAGGLAGSKNLAMLKSFSKKRRSAAWARI